MPEPWTSATCLPPASRACTQAQLRRRSLLQRHLFSLLARATVLRWIALSVCTRNPFCTSSPTSLPIFSELFAFVSKCVTAPSSPNDASKCNRLSQIVFIGSDAHACALAALGCWGSVDALFLLLARLCCLFSDIHCRCLHAHASIRRCASHCYCAGARVMGRASGRLQPYPRLFCIE
jgi:hypothetical protein